MSVPHHRLLLFTTTNAKKTPNLVAQSTADTLTHIDTDDIFLLADLVTTNAEVTSLVDRGHLLHIFRCYSVVCTRIYNLAMPVKR